MLDGCINNFVDNTTNSQESNGYIPRHCTLCLNGLDAWIMISCDRCVWLK